MDARRMMACFLAIPILLQCGGEPDADRGTTPPSASTSAAVTDESGSIRDEAEAIVSFLRGSEPLDADLLADSITFRVADEGGGATRIVSRETLVDRAAGTVGGSRSGTSPCSSVKVDRIVRS